MQIQYSVTVLAIGVFAIPGIASLGDAKENAIARDERAASPTPSSDANSPDVGRGTTGVHGHGGPSVHPSVVDGNLANSRRHDSTGSATHSSSSGGVSSGRVLSGGVLGGGVSTTVQGFTRSISLAFRALDAVTTKATEARHLTLGIGDLDNADAVLARVAAGNLSTDLALDRLGYLSHKARKHDPELFAARGFIENVLPNINSSTDANEYLHALGKTYRERIQRLDRWQAEATSAEEAQFAVERLDRFLAFGDHGRYGNILDRHFAHSPVARRLGGRLRSFDTLKAETRGRLGWYVPGTIDRRLVLKRPMGALLPLY